MREDIEWVNLWIEDANNLKKKRILLMGDSVARDYRKSLNRLLAKDDYVVDLLAMSYSIFDELFVNEIHHFANVINKQYEYHYILFNLGTHHGYSFACKNDDLLQKKFCDRLEEIFKLLNKLNVQIIVLSGTPENKKEKEEQNDEILCRNRLLKHVAQKYRYLFIDLYKKIYNKDFNMVDRFHYSECDCEYISYKIYKALGFNSVKVKSNRIDRLDEFLKILDNKNIYIFGDGKRGRILYDFLRCLNNTIKGFIVSNEFYKCNQDQILLENIIGNFEKNDIIIITPEDINVWEKIEEAKFTYYTLSKRIYLYMEQYINMQI